MPDQSLDTLLENANTCVGQGEWEKAIQLFIEAAELKPTDPEIWSEVGMCYINNHQTNRALPYFQKAQELVPDSAEVVNNLGIVYSLLNDLVNAEKSFKKSIQLQTDYLPGWRNLAQTYLRQEAKVSEGVQILASIVQAYPRDTETLVLLGSCYELGNKFSSAKTLYDKALEVDPQNTLAAEGLARVTPIIEKQIQATKSEQARKLSALKSLKKSSSKPGEENKIESIPLPTAFEQLKNFSSIAFYGIPELMRTNQIETWAKMLSKSGVKVKIDSEVRSADLEEYEFLVFSQPNLSGDYLNGIKNCISANKTFGIDLDHDYFSLTDDMPTYFFFGKGNPQAVQALELLLREAEWVSVSSEESVKRYQNLARKQVHYLQPTWDRENTSWKKAKTQRNTFNLGWIGTSVERPNLEWIKEEISAFVVRHPDVLFVITGDNTAYRSFPDIPEQQITFVPSIMQGNDIPFIFSQFDALIIPRMNTPYNQSESNQFLVYAGVSQVPWLASPIPAVQTWGEGGIIVQGNTGWDAHLEELYQHPDLREQLGLAGLRKAESC